MAVIPDVQISTRQIETSPSLHYFQSLKGENGRAIGSAISTTGNALDRIWEVQRRERERAQAEAERQAEKRRIEAERAQRAHEVSVNRDAEYLNNQCENYLANSLVGHMETDPTTGEQKEVKGKWSKTYAELESEKTSLPKLTEDAIREMREEQWYKDASPEVRAAAERKFTFTRDRWMRKAFEENGRLKQADAVDKMKKNIEFNLNGAAATFGSKQKVVDPRTGAKISTYQYAAVRAGLKNFGALQGSEIENPEIIDNPTARFEDLKWSRKLTEEQIAEKRDQYNDCIYKVYVNRIGALQKAGATGQQLGEYSPAQCLEEADKMADMLHAEKRIRKAADGSDIPVVNDAQYAEIKAETAKARRLLDGVRASVHKQTGEKKAVDFRKRIEGLEDTRVMLARRAQMQTAEEYAKEINGLVDGDALDRKTGDQYIANYKKLLDHCDDIRKMEKRGEGVWLKQKDRNGKLIDVFEPYRHGNGKSETDQSHAEKYTKVDRNGNTPFQNDPARGMEELDFDYKMGNISLPFYNAQMAKMRVFSDTKAKAAFVKVFGCNGDIFPEKDVAEFRKQGIDTGTRTIWAKTREWNHGDGYTGANWLADAQKNYLFEGGEKKVSLEQQAELCEIIKSMTADGMDPTETIHNYLAPIFKDWAQTDLVNRLDPNFKIGGRNFRERMMDSKRYATPYDPKTRDSRLQARMKKAYGDVTPDEQ